MSDAVRDLEYLARLGENLADTTPGWLMQMNLEAMTSQVVRQHAGHFNENVAGEVLTVLSNSSLRDNLGRAFSGEVRAVNALSNQLAGQSSEERARFLEIIATQAQSQAGSKADPALMEKMRDTAWLASELQYIRDTEEQMAEALLNPPAEYEAWWNGVQNHLASEHPLAATILPSLAAVRGQLDRHLVEQALLQAGLELLYTDPEEAEPLEDPLTGKPFAYVKKKGGFELQSTFTVQGKPLTMAFSKPKPRPAEPEL
jgi:hypothetical protein